MFEFIQIMNALIWLAIEELFINRNPDFSLVTCRVQTKNQTIHCDEDKLNFLTQQLTKFRNTT